jgi:hypothetical protein
MKCTDCHREIRPVIGCDIDGTLAEYHLAITKFSCRYYNLPAPTFPYDGSEKFRDYLGLTETQHEAMKLAFRQGGNKRMLRPIAGAVEFAQKMYGAAEFWVATTRPWQRLDNIDPDTQEWLRRNGIAIDGLLFGEDKYQQLIDAVGLDRIVGVFDDLAVQIDIAASLGLPTWQVYRPHNSSPSQRRSSGGASFEAAADWGLLQIHEWRISHG